MSFRIYKVEILFLGVILLGVLGYTSLFDFSFIDGLYMTIITVGFSEVNPLSYEAKLFTVFLILISISLYGYLVAVVSEFLLNGNLVVEQKKNILKKINKFEGHTIVCEFGRNGWQTVAKLNNFIKSCVVIEITFELLKEIEEQGFIFIEGDATDADNLYVVLSARQLNSKLNIVSKATNEPSIKKLKIAGADNVIMPDKLGRAHMASLVVNIRFS
ncbi:potassium channel family protein [Flavicella sp.]|uniref:potassium channel family protein n=1 Tax=Flavicella sp. TaxID=2957742 RepID=UPI0030185A8B